MFFKMLLIEMLPNIYLSAVGFRGLSIGARCYACSAATPTM